MSHESSIIYHLSSSIITQQSPITYHHLSSIIYHLSSVIVHSSSMIYHRSSIIVHLSPFIYHCSSIIIYHHHHHHHHHRHHHMFPSFVSYHVFPDSSVSQLICLQSSVCLSDGVRFFRLFAFVLVFHHLFLTICLPLHLSPHSYVSPSGSVLFLFHRDFICD